MGTANESPSNLAIRGAGGTPNGSPLDVMERVITITYAMAVRVSCSHLQPFAAICGQTRTKTRITFDGYLSSAFWWVWGAALCNQIAAICGHVCPGVCTNLGSQLWGNGGVPV